MTVERAQNEAAPVTQRGDAPAAQDTAFLSVRGLKMYFPGTHKGMWPWQGRRVVRAVDGVDFAIPRGQTFGLVGESGCGKSTVARCVLRLYEPTAGEVHFEGRNLLQLAPRELEQMRKKAQIVFQDPYASLDPRRTIGYTIGEPLLIHGMKDARARRRRVAELMQLVGLNPSYENRYPHALSGGQRQRVGIARALATEPTFIVADEPISALDVSIQAQVLNLMKELQGRLGLTYLFISHDLGVVRHICDSVAVMYLGRIVEMAPTDELFRHPYHPYTKALLAAIPKPRWVQPLSAQVKIEGDVPSPLTVQRGCPFAARCPIVQPDCREDDVPLRDVGAGHKVACLYWNA